MALGACGDDVVGGEGSGSSSSTSSSGTSGETLPPTTAESSGTDSETSSSSGEGSSSGSDSTGGPTTGSSSGSGEGTGSSSGDDSSSSTGTAEVLCGDDLSAPGEFCFEIVAIDGIVGGDRGIEVLDVDGDGDIDIVTGSNVIRADDAGGYVVTTPLPGGSFIAAGQLDADGTAEVAIPGSDTLGIHHLNDDGGVASTDVYAFGGSNGYAAKIGDLVGGADLDVAVAALSSASVQVYENTAGVLTPLAPLSLSGFGARHVEISDLDADGNGDLIVAEDGSALTVFLGTGGAFAAPTTTATSGLFTTISIGDVNNDDVPDIVGASPTGMFAQVLYGDGDGGIASTQLVPLPVGPRAVGVGDFNSDGIADLVAVDYEDSTDLVVLLGEGDQNFAEPEVIVFPTWGHDLAVADVNDDGVDDVVVYGNGIGILRSTL